MTPFALAIREDGFENPKLFKSNDEVATLHNLQSHTADLSLLVSTPRAVCFSLMINTVVSQ